MSHWQKDSNPYKDPIDREIYETYRVAPTDEIRKQYIPNRPIKITFTKEESKSDEPWDWANQRPKREELEKLENAS